MTMAGMTRTAHVLRGAASTALALLLAACTGVHTDTSSSSAGTSGTTGTSGTSASLAFAASTYSVAQNAGSLTVTVNRTGGSAGAVTVAYASANGTAVAGTDFSAAGGILSWADGDSAGKTFTVTVSDTTPFSGSKTFSLVLSSATGGASLVSPSTATVSIVGSSTTPPSGVFGIKVSGNRFVSTLTGNNVQIVGTNISGLETGYKSRWPSFSAAGSAFWSNLVNIDSSGLNTVRLPLNEASWLNYTCYDSGSGASASFYTAASGGGYTPDPSSIYQSTVKQTVAAATAAGLYVILDLHWGAPNNASAQPLCPIGQPSYADNDHSVTFWKQVADAFKGNPAVIFELFNEPYGTNVYGNWVIQNGSTYTPGPDATRLFTGGNFSPFLSQNNANGDATVTTNITYDVASMNTLLQTIRGEGATNVVLASPIGFAGEIETWLGTYTGAGNPDPLKQFGVAWHLYGYAKGTAPPLAVLAAGYPIAVTETYGFDAALDGQKNANGYTWAASEGIGYIWWGWNDWGNQALSTLLNETPWFMSTAP